MRLDALGDVLMTTPAIRALKEALPEREITLLTSSAGADVARLIPEIDGTIAYDAPWVKASEPRANGASDREIIAQLRDRDFDAAVIFTVFSQSPLPAALMCFLADIALRLAHCRENPYQLLTSWLPDPDPERGVRHEVRRQLDLVASLGCLPSSERLSLEVPPDACGRVLQRLELLDIDPARPWVVVHPGASAPSRRYPPEHFAEACRRLAREARCRIVLTGGANESELVDGIRRAVGAVSDSLAGALSLAELAALIALAPLLITNNTGPAHIAAAVGTPVVDLYALTNPQHTPWQVPSRVLAHDVPCKYCFKSVCPEGHHDCLRLVPPEAVVTAARELLADGETLRRASTPPPAAAGRAAPESR